MAVVAKWFVVFWKRFGADHKITWVGYVVNVIRFFQKHIMWPSIKEQFSHFSPQKKNHILHENFEAHHLIQHGQYLRILLERWTKKFTYVPTTYHYIIKQNFCCHCIVDIKLPSQTVSRINKKCMSSNQRRQILKMMTFLQLSKYVLLYVHQFHQNSTFNNKWDDISMCYKVQFLTTNNEDKYSNNASTFYY